MTQSDLSNTGHPRGAELPPGRESLATEAKRGIAPHSEQSNIDEQIETDYVLEKLQEIRDIVAEMIEGVELGRMIHMPDGGLSALEAIGAATYAAEARWCRS